jgi:hypothetical protein
MWRKIYNEERLIYINECLGWFFVNEKKIPCKTNI